MKFTLFAFVLSAIAISAQNAPPPAQIQPSAPDSASAATMHAAQLDASQPIALRVVGSNVRNPGGDYLGRIDTVMIDRHTGRAEYALLVGNNSTASNLYTPIPWESLNYAWDQAQAGGTPGALQVFVLNLDRAALQRAPTIERTQLPAIRQPEFARQLAAFYGPAVGSAVGTAGTASDTITGGGAGGPAVGAGPTVVDPGGAIITPPDAIGVSPSPPSVFPPSFTFPGFAVVETNFVGTNIVLTTNVVATNVAGVGTNVVMNLTNFPPQFRNDILGGNPPAGTNIPGLAGRTNLPPGAALAGRTNLVGGGPLPAGGTNLVGGRSVLGTNTVGPGPLPGAVAPVAPQAGPGPLPGAVAPVTPQAGAPTGRPAVQPPIFRPVRPGTGGPGGQVVTPQPPPQVTPPQVTPPQVTPPQVTPPQVTPPQVTPPQVTPPQVRAPQVPVTPPAAVPPAPPQQ